MGIKFPFHLLNIRPSQAILFAPGVILLLMGLTVARNYCSRPVICMKDFPDRAYTVMVYLQYPIAYPFTGDVEAFFEIRRIQSREPIYSQSLGSHRWASAAAARYWNVEWVEPGLITFQPREGKDLQTVKIRESALDGDGSDGGPRGWGS